MKGHSQDDFAKGTQTLAWGPDNHGLECPAE